MRLNGSWAEGHSGVWLPTISIDVRAFDESWRKSRFLIDTGADITVLRYDLLYELQLEPESDDGSFLSGVGGESTSVRVATTLRFERDDGILVSFNGTFHGFTDPTALDISVLGRDVLGHFAAIVDRPGKLVTLLAGQHRYEIFAPGL